MTCYEFYAFGHELVGNLDCQFGIAAVVFGVKCQLFTVHATRCVDVSNGLLGSPA